MHGLVVQIAQTHRLGLDLAWAAQHGAQPRQQLGGHQRLGDVVVGPPVQPLDAVGQIGAHRRHHDDRHVPPPRPHRAQQRDPVAVGQVPVEEHRVVGERRLGRHGVGQGVDQVDGEPPGGQRGHGGGRQGGLVFHEQDAHGHSPRRAGTRRTGPAPGGA